MPGNWKTILSIAGGVAAAGAVVRAYLRESRRITLRDKTVLITGGSRGLGVVLAREFAARGARVAVCARSDHELERIRDEFADSGHALVTIRCDVGVRAEVGHMVASVREQLGEVDILVNNAGTILVGPAEHQDTEAFEDVMQTNFWGPHYAICEVLKQMKPRRFGRIVNIASVGGKLAFPHLLPYSASKFALVGYSEGLRVELAKHNIFVTTVCPGLMRTGSPRHAQFAGQAAREYAWFAISDSLPITSISVKTAARRIVDACICGEAEIHIGATAALGAVLQGCAPGLTAELLSLVDQLLPRALAGSTETKTGADAGSEISESRVSQATRRAEIANNQV